MVTIRKAKLSDVPEIVELWNEFMSDVRDIVTKNDKKLSGYTKLKSNATKLFRDFVADNIRSSKGLVLVAEVDKELVGYSLSYIKENIVVYELRKLGYISDLFIKKEYRRQWIGSNFKTKIFSWFKAKGIQHTSIMVSPANPNAYKAYQKWGYQPFHLEMRRKL